MRGKVAKMLRRWTKDTGTYEPAKKHYQQFSHTEKQQLKKETEQHGK